MNTLSWADDRLIFLSGDGGSIYDPFDQAQSNSSLLGKAVAIDVEHRPWTFSDNPRPVVDLDDLDPARRASIKIVGKGLHNPSGLEVDGTIKYLTDRGEDQLERINAFTKWKKNFGWRAWEGIVPTIYRDEAYELADSHKPFAFYSHHETRPSLLSMTPGRGVVGGTVYRGNDLPSLYNHYIFGDVEGDLLAVQALGPEEDDNPVPRVPERLNLDRTNFILTAIGSNRKRTRIFVGGYDRGQGGIYELTSSNDIDQYPSDDPSHDQNSCHN